MFDDHLFRFVLRQAASALDVSQNDILSSRRSTSCIEARHLAMYLMKASTTLSYPEIGTVFGRDHTTILSGVQRHEERMRSSPQMHKRTATIIKRIEDLKGEMTVPKDDGSTVSISDRSPVALTIASATTDRPTHPFIRQQIARRVREAAQSLNFADRNLQTALAADLLREPAAFAKAIDDLRENIAASRAALLDPIKPYAEDEEAA
ncbi:MAG: helix-turn-helix domain-containing protein [Pseudomonadota bacterium]